MTTPLPHQAEDLPILDGLLLRALLGYDMGLGKTFMALSCLHRHPEIKRALVVCPASLKYMWQRQASEHINLPAEILSTRKPPRRKGFLFRSRLLIINYDVLAWWLDWLSEYDPQLIILDECHALQSRTTKRTKAVRWLCNGKREVEGQSTPPHVLALSGTPLLNRHAELWPVLNIVRPDVYRSFTSFANRFCNPRRTHWGWDYSRSINSDLLHKELLTTCMVRRRKADVLKDLPPIMHQVIPLDINNRSEYETAKKDVVGWLRTKSPALARKAARAEEFAKLAYLRQLAYRGKLNEVFGWLDDYRTETDEKLIVGCIHTEVLDALQTRYNNICLRMSGKTPPKQRQEIFDVFNGKNKYQFLFGNIDVVGMGLSCRSTSKVALAEFPWTPAKVAQFASRVHGINRGVAGVPVQVYHLVARDTIEERLCAMLQAKQGTVSNVLDGGKQEDDLNLFDLLVKEMKGG